MLRGISGEAGYVVSGEYELVQGQDEGKMAGPGNRRHLQEHDYINLLAVIIKLLIYIKN